MTKKNLILENYIRVENLKSESLKKLKIKFEKIFKSIKQDVKDIKKTLNILDSNFNFNFKIKNLNKFKKYKTIAIIGMGGSILGAEAIYQFLGKKINKEVYFFNDLNENQISSFKKKKKFSKTLFLIISKSGSTIETLSNVFLLNILRKDNKNIIVITEKKNNFLYYLSKKFNLFYIEHKDNVGGRYSVLSEVGIIPAHLMGINVHKLRSKILNCLNSRNKTFLKNSTTRLAALINSKKFNNLIFLNYAPNLEKFLYWNQQLIAESLGKQNKGFLPVVSNVPKDHHSLLQLYLDGPKDKIFNIFSLDTKSKEIINLKKDIKFQSFLNKKTLGKIKTAQKNALIKSLLKNKIPFREFKIKNCNEETLGKLFSYFIVETIIIGKLLNINPFDQPAVEEVKFFTKKLLN